jgi:hypothetical protein
MHKSLAWPITQTLLRQITYHQLMPMKKAAYVIALVLILAIMTVAVGILVMRLEVNREEKNNLFTYPLSVGNKTFIITVKTNWDAERKPSITLLNVTDINRHSIELYFLGGIKKNISYNITIPTDLLWGEISLVWKYYLQDPDSYTLSNNCTHNTLQKTFEYDPFFSGSGYFEILGTEGAW